MIVRFRILVNIADINFTDVSQLIKTKVIIYGLLLPAEAGIGEIFISLGSRTNIVQNRYPAFLVLPEVFDQTAATAYDIQPHQFWVVFISAQGCENI